MTKNFVRLGNRIKKAETEKRRVFLSNGTGDGDDDEMQTTSTSNIHKSLAEFDRL